ncbi:phospho-N-acetylmuramoyl-pentapeptide-transferase [Phycisphaera mikurensis]|uniref:Phospho-N-acetylmuramoyl-pentapeptide-transferase n=1 Tax=Phycisphaera mikurensis (strain NBRC 102666 / KCTC 22515 / FYK2301M01) TaxID=1142394 RepID=I0IHB9_PHYMF|nr:phospho-N-acetylmuramoyl-pentapeptide-transferase [Phycisphaera mikurensis]MBB6440906.1 phospho-N-acetylmuramoyl-pentapeptide-transferase [Phycisphaera mikurensis]BAM04657.1 phospho-N-acetylmuramoyl-pentapeptide-transferase [Phycisphaera mikurensis NBRC 102666]
MIPWLLDALGISASDSSAVRAFGVFRWVEFRAVLAVVLAFVTVVACAPRVIRWLITQKIGDRPEFHNRALNELTQHKSNVPTMGGVLIAGAIFGVTLLLADLRSFYVVMAMACLVSLCAIGFADDWLKLTAGRRNAASRDGLRSWEKLLFQLGVAALLGWFTYRYGVSKFAYLNEFSEMARSVNLPGLKAWVREGGVLTQNPAMLVLPAGAFVLVATLLITGFSNAVNLTDGMDGLASGITVICAFLLMILCVIAGYQSQGFVLAKYLLVPHIPLSDELAVVAGAMVGACLGFLWFNCNPAQVFMGDTGSLPLGGLLAYIAVVIRQEFLLLVVGGVFLLEIGSVVLQVGYFKMTGGKRVFRCAPIHHHFHLTGWTEQQVVVRAWVVTALLAALALAAVKLR